MKPLTGEIGKLALDGKQVGGFRNWTAFVQIKPPIKSWVIASGFWMLSKTNTDKVMASFFCQDGDTLKLICKREAVVHLPETYPLDKLVIKPTEITFEEDFDWRDG